MPLYDSPFGGPLPTNLPQMRGLPMPTPGNVRPQQPMVGVPDMGMQQPAMPAPQRSEMESIIGGISGLWKQSREDDEKKQKEAAAKSLYEQIAELKRSREAAPAAPVQDAVSRATNESVPADLDDYMKRNRMFESGDNLDATNAGSGASGIYQFLPSTWNWIAKEAPELGLTAEGIRDRDQQNKAMHYYTRKSQRVLEPLLGRKATGGELYLLHLLGHSGGPTVLSALDRPITETISPGAYKGNPFLKQYTTGHDLIAGLNKTFGGNKT